MKNIHGSGGTAGSSLHAAALSMARGASGVWLRAVCRLGLLCRGTVYLLVGYEQAALPRDPSALAWIAKQLTDALDSGRFASVPR